MKRALCIAMWLLGGASAAIADEAVARREDQIKAAYLFNFVKFVEWPPETVDEAIEICFVGATGVRDSLQSASADKRVGAHRVVVRPLQTGDLATRCAVVYFDGRVANQSDALLQSARAQSLTVSDAANFTRNGGVIQLYTEVNRLRFVINVENGRRAGLRISSNLLKLASDVEQDGAP